VSKETPRRFVVLISGRGGNMQAIARALHDQNAMLCAVISNQPQAAGLTWAQNQGIATQAVDHRAWPTRAAFEQVLGDAIAQYTPDYILLAGFMRILTPTFTERFQGQLLNIHPSLLPLFPGLHTHQQALHAGVCWHGCTVHFVTAELDHGPIVAQGIVPVSDQDSAETLAQRLLPLEHAVYAHVARWLAQGRVALQTNGQVHVAGVAHRAFTLDSAGLPMLVRGAA